MSGVMRLAALLALTPLLAAGGGEPGEPREPRAALPLAVSDSGTLLVMGSVAGRKVEVTVDTGAGACRFPPSALEGSPAGSVKGTGRLGEPPLFDLVRVAEVAVGEARWKEALVATWPLLDEMHAGGVVSARLFERTPVTIAAREKRLLFESAESLAARAAAGEALPLELVREGEASLLLLVPALVDGTKRRLVLDTAFPGALELPGGGTHAVALGALRWRVSAGARETPAVDGRLGLGFFEGRALTLDLPASRLIVAR